MLKVKPKTPLTAAIISSLVSKTIHLLKAINSDELPEAYAGKNFYWQTSTEDGSPNLQILYPLETWFIWWNGKFEGQLKVKSNISVDAENHLQDFINVESLLVSELSEILAAWELENSYKVETNGTDL